MIYMGKVVVEQKSDLKLQPWKIQSVNTQSIASHHWIDLTTIQWCNNMNLPGLIAVFSQNTQHSLSFVQSFGGLV